MCRYIVNMDLEEHSLQKIFDHLESMPDETVAYGAARYMADIRMMCSQSEKNADIVTHIVSAAFMITENHKRKTTKAHLRNN